MEELQSSAAQASSWKSARPTDDAILGGQSLTSTGMPEWLFCQLPAVNATTGLPFLPCIAGALSNPGQARSAPHQTVRLGGGIVGGADLLPVNSHERPKLHVIGRKVWMGGSKETPSSQGHTLNMNMKIFNLCFFHVK